MALYTRKPVAVTAARTIPGTELKRIPDGVGGFVEYQPGDWILRFEDGHAESISPAKFKAEYDAVVEQPWDLVPAGEVPEQPLADLVPDPVLTLDPEAEDETPVPQADGDPEEPS